MFLAETILRSQRAYQLAGVRIEQRCNAEGDGSSSLSIPYKPFLVTRALGECYAEIEGIHWLLDFLLPSLPLSIGGTS